MRRKRYVVVYLFGFLVGWLGLPGLACVGVVFGKVVQAVHSPSVAPGEQMAADPETGSHGM